MPTKKLGRTKCQPQKKVRTKCQPLVGIMSGWHFVRLAFCPHTPPAPEAGIIPLDHYATLDMFDQQQPHAKQNHDHGTSRESYP